MTQHFARFARFVADATGSPYGFAGAVLLVLVWAGAGPLMGFSDFWLLLINTATTIITFWMVFLIQHTQDRDTRAIQEKLDEIIRSLDTASNDLIGIEERAEDLAERTADDKEVRP